MKKQPKTLKGERLLRRRRQIRKKISGTSDKPRVSVSRSNKNFFAQIIDDESSTTILGMGTLSKEMREQIKNGGCVESSKRLGEKIAQQAKEKGIEKIVFDRNGYRYHGRVKAFAQALRDSGLKF